MVFNLNSKSLDGQDCVYAGTGTGTGRKVRVSLSPLASP
jgi:hypothetical protein